MATGRPDYVREIRPRFGGACQKSDLKVVEANVVTLLTSISGKGVIYGGSVWLDYTGSQANAEIMMKLDGYFIFSPSFRRMNDYGISKPGSSIITVNKFDDVAFIYCAGLSYGITFDSSLDLGYHEQNGTTPTVHYDIVYALL